ncbi:MAG: M23 family metallopeptidase [Thermodesulfovibrionales bacterium]|nr:M23 family metallopeptidase [Thermodesulfovibrionales bacterium]
MVSHLLLTLTFFLLTCTSAFAFHVELSPDMISPGDPFVVKVTGVDDQQVPTASLTKKTFPFSRYGDDGFVGIGAVDVTTKPGTYFLTVKAGKKRKNIQLTVKRTVFKTQKLRLPKKVVSLCSEDKQRVRQENRQLKELFSKMSERNWEGEFIIPLPNEISTDFGTKRIFNRKWKVVHKGLDIRGREGEEIRAANSGVVVLAEELFYGGNTVILDHGQGIYTVYMHLSQYNVEPDDSVTKGEVIGLVGMTGRSTGPHLHFGVKVMNLNANPVSFMKLPL